MKSLILTMTLSLAFLSLSAQEKGANSKQDCNVRNLTIQGISNDNLLFPFIIDEDRRGVLELHPFSIDELGGWEAFKSSLTDDLDVTFSLIGKKVSRLYQGTYFRYQQYYKGIPVEDGGFTILVDTEDPQAFIGPPCEGCPVGPSNPCDLVFMVAPNIYEDIEIPTSPSLSNTAIETSLANQVVQVEEKELKVVNNLDKECEFRLVYKINYRTKSEGDVVGWLDAHTGETLHKANRHNNKNAPTTDFGVQFMNDEIDGNNTVLRNDRLTAHDMSGIVANRTRDLGNDFDNDQIPESPTNRDWNCIDQGTTCNDAPGNVYQAFWMTDQVIDAFETELGIVFEDVHIGIHPTAFGATSFGPAHPDDRANFTFGVIGANSTVEFDVIAHELGHTILREFFSSAQIEGGSLHEAIGDMFGTYIESILDPNGLDWVMGDDIPFTVRDLQNTNRNCFTNIQNLTSVHDRGEALGHWFFLCVNGDAANGIPSVNIHEIMSLVTEALPSLGSNPDYPDLMEATLDIAESVYGTCSDQFLSVLRAWEAICVPTGHYMADDSQPCAYLTDDHYTCEESDYFKVCLSDNSGLNTTFGRWTIIGRNSTSFTSVVGMQGNSQNGGRCLEITGIPDMPFYPQTVTIKYWNSNIGQSVTRKVKIVDCNGDDPTCEEYYNNQGLVISSDATGISSQFEFTEQNRLDSNHFSNSKSLIVFDLMGNRLDITEENVNSLQNSYKPQIVIFTYWNQNNELVATKKVFIH